MKIKLKTYSFRFAEQILNQNLSLKIEVEDVIYIATKDLSILSKEVFFEILKKEFYKMGWKDQNEILSIDSYAHQSFHCLKGRIAVQIEFAPSSCIGNDLLNFQLASYSSMDLINLGIYITTTSTFQKYLDKEHDIKWEGTLSYKKVINYLDFAKSIIQVPIFVLGVDIERGEYQQNDVTSKSNINLK